MLSKGKQKRMIEAIRKAIAKIGSKDKYLFITQEMEEVLNHNELGVEKLYIPKEFETTKDSIICCFEGHNNESNKFQTFKIEFFSNGNTFTYNDDFPLFSDFTYEICKFYFEEVALSGSYNR